jgi:hypothetical protein
MTSALLKPLSALTLAMALAAPAQATVVSAASDGYGLLAGVSVLGTPILGLTALGHAQGSSTGNPPATYSDAAELKAVAKVGAKVGAKVDTSTTDVKIGSGLLSKVVKADVKVTTDINAKVGADALYGKAGFDGTTASGEGGILGAKVNVSANVKTDTTADLLGVQVVDLHTAVNLPVVDLSAGVLSSTSSVTGDYGAWTASGDSVITDLGLSILGKTVNWLTIGDEFVTGDLDATLGLDGKVQITAAPNTRINLFGLLDLAGVFLTLNEQDEDCAAASCSIETNAFHLWADPLYLGLVDLDLKLGHSSAMLAGQPSAVPLPGSLWMMLGGLGVLGTIARRRKQTA